MIMNAKILAAVGGHNVTEAEVEEFLAALGPRGDAYRNPEGKAAIVEELINRKLFLLEAQRNLFEAEAGFKAQLKQAKETLLINYAIEKALSAVKVKEEEIVAFELRTLYQKYGYLPYKMSKFEEYDLYARNNTRSL